MKKFLDAVRRHYDDYNEEGASFVIGLICLFIAMLLMIPPIFNVKAEWAGAYINAAFGFIALGTAIWFLDTVFYVGYSAWRDLAELIRKHADRKPSFSRSTNGVV